MSRYATIVIDFSVQLHRSQHVQVLVSGQRQFRGLQYSVRRLFRGLQNCVRGRQSRPRSALVRQQRGRGQISRPRLSWPLRRGTWPFLLQQLRMAGKQLSTTFWEQ